VWELLAPCAREIKTERQRQRDRETETEIKTEIKTETETDRARDGHASEPIPRNSKWWRSSQYCVSGDSTTTSQSR
jgi:hypothetical protein